MTQPNAPHSTTSSPRLRRLGHALLMAAAILGTAAVAIGSPATPGDRIYPIGRLFPVAAARAYRGSMLSALTAQGYELLPPVRAHSAP